MKADALKIVPKSQANYTSVTELTESMVVRPTLRERAYAALVAPVLRLFGAVAWFVTRRAIVVLLAFGAVCCACEGISRAWNESRSIMLSEAYELAKAKLAPLGFAPVAHVLAPSRDELIEQAANRHSVSADLIRAIIWKESRNKRAVTADCGVPERCAVGLMQVLPAWIKWAPSLGLSSWTELYDEATNIDTGSWIVASNLQQAKGDLERALILYRVGPKGTAKDCDANCAKNYAREVTNIMASRKFSGVRG